MLSKQSILQVEQTTNTRRNDLRRAYNRQVLRAGATKRKRSKSPPKKKRKSPPKKKRSKMAKKRPSKRRSKPKNKRAEQSYKGPCRDCMTIDLKLNSGVAWPTAEERQTYAQTIDNPAPNKFFWLQTNINRLDVTCTAKRIIRGQAIDVDQTLSALRQRVLDLPLGDFYDEVYHGDGINHEFTRPKSIPDEANGKITFNREWQAWYDELDEVQQAAFGGDYFEKEYSDLYLYVDDPAIMDEIKRESRALALHELQCQHTKELIDLLQAIYQQQTGEEPYEEEEGCPCLIDIYVQLHPMNDSNRVGLHGQVYEGGPWGSSPLEVQTLVTSVKLTFDDDVSGWVDSAVTRLAKTIALLTRKETDQLKQKLITKSRLFRLTDPIRKARERKKPLTHKQAKKKQEQEARRQADQSMAVNKGGRGAWGYIDPDGNNWW